MSERRPQKARSFRRAFEGFFDKLGTRPISLIVFIVSGVLLLSLEFGSSQHIEAPAVARATPTHYSATSETVVTLVHVEPGDRVVPGTPLATLSIGKVERELAVVEAEISRMERLAQLEQMRLANENDGTLLDLKANLREAERDAAVAAAEQYSRGQRARAAEQYQKKIAERVEKRIASRGELDDAERESEMEDARLARARRAAKAQREYVEGLAELNDGAPIQSPLTSTMADYYEAELELLKTRRDNVLSQIAEMTLVASKPGRVATVLPAGSPATPGITVVTVMPEQATEIVAYVPPDTNPTAITEGSAVSIVEPVHSCDTDATVLRRGAAVEEAPAWLRSVFRFPVHGLPVYISVPAECSFGVGQKLTVELHPG